MGWVGFKENKIIERFGSSGGGATLPSSLEQPCPERSSDAGP